MDTRLMQQIKEILKEFPQYWDGEELQRPIVISDLKNYDALLISALLKNQKIRENYSIKAGDIVIFKVQEFIDILRYKDYWADSYTKYSNTIGLSSEGKYLQYNTDVVLDFPYKDCILEGGMTKDDVGKEEIFYNEVIARDEIDTLLAPKVFTNVKKYDSDGEHEIDSFCDKDNLIIKGNNLLALHSLKERYAGKVKLIYIDPPYNTGSDSFKYNDRFNHSTWLTFMKNRIEIAKELLTDDGIIVCQCDYHENSYLRVLLDEIFGFDNFVQEITIKMSSASGPKMAHVESNIPKLKDSLLIFKKNKLKILKQPLVKKSVWDNEYKKILINFTKEDYDLLQNNIENQEIDKVNDILSKIKLSSVSKEFPENKNNPEWLSNNAYRIVADKQNTSLDKLLSSLNNHPLQDVAAVHSKRGGIYLYRTDKDFGLDSRVEIVFAEKNQYENACDIWLDISTSGGFSYEGNISFPTAKKPEKLMRRILEMFAEPNQDIVLDFFCGSGSTLSTAQKLGIQYIGVEQMSYFEEITVQRLKNVIDADNTGISKEVNWQGGGSFVYAELMELNQFYMTRIDEASIKEELANLWNELSNNADLNFQLDKEKLMNELLKERDEETDSITFNDLTLDEQKEIFKKALDKNQLYVPYLEIDDANVVLSDKDKAFNHSFYNDEGE
ncbi:site-specific DNA-methyltransferase [Carnobacterium divergens]|uniref:site-specific DNA-methyltransferase n=1 Tax=Carnobacterium divergens TaxID=2748 RepID=UPI00128D3104|nr:site-specific DNA-methyltransferase [Carnobacterium divergens]MPQ21450.1 site-specific DNA-methyltransferase [Carnobacterium divergens]